MALLSCSTLTRLMCFFKTLPSLRVPPPDCLWRAGRSDSLRCRLGILP